MMDDLEKLQPLITNNLLENTEIYNKKNSWVGIIAKNPDAVMSPKKWNHVFKELEMDSIYLALGVELENLGKVVAALKETENLRGFNMAAYKVEIMEFLDEIDPLAESIGSVNLVVKKNGILIGYNTDGLGEVSNITKKQPGNDAPLMETLAGKTIVQLGCGGAGRAVAYSVAQAMQTGTFILLNRTPETAKEVADKIKLAQPELIVESGSEEIFSEKAKTADLIINTTGKGAASHNLEEYSALAPAVGDKSESDISQNNESSLKLAKEIPKQAKFADIVHTPPETVFMKHARKTGHNAIGGAGMNIGQAVEGFKMVFPESSASMEKLIEVMAGA